MTQAENDRLDRIEATLESLVTEVRRTNNRLERQDERIEKMEEEFKWWEQRFFDLARDTKNISIGLIVSAVVAILLFAIMK